MDFKQLRKDMIIVVNTINNLQGSRELSLAKTKSQEAMMWTGTLLKYISNSPTPYANNGKRKTIADIEPMFDNTSETFKFGDNQVQVVDGLREFLDNKASHIIAFSFDFWTEMTENGVDEASFLISDCLDSMRKYLTEARMWLGMELGRLRDA